MLLLGTDFPYDDFLPRPAPSRSTTTPGGWAGAPVLELGVHGDMGETLRAVLPLSRPSPTAAFLDRMLRKHAKALENRVSSYTRNVEHHLPIHPEYPAAVLDELAADDAVFTVDTGMCNVWAARYITPNGRRRVIGSFLHGTMANALPHAIGAQFADRGRQVISLSGDGGLGMLMGELLTVGCTNCRSRSSCSTTPHLAWSSWR